MASVFSGRISNRRSVDVPIPDGVSQVRVTLDRSTWAGADPGSPVVVRLDVSFDGGATFRGAAGGSFTANDAANGEALVGLVVKDGFADAARTRLSGTQDAQITRDGEVVAEREGDGRVRFCAIPLRSGRVLRVNVSVQRAIDTEVDVTWL